jgi:hypothetical protein
MSRRNTDERRRRADRDALIGGSGQPGHEVELLTLRLRDGSILAERVGVAAKLGDPVSQIALGLYDHPDYVAYRQSPCRYWDSESLRRKLIFEAFVGMQGRVELTLWEIDLAERVLPIWEALAKQYDGDVDVGRDILSESTRVITTFGGDARDHREEYLEAAAKADELREREAAAEEFIEQHFDDAPGATLLDGIRALRVALNTLGTALDDQGEFMWGITHAAIAAVLSVPPGDRRAEILWQRDRLIYYILRHNARHDSARRNDGQVRPTRLDKRLATDIIEIHHFVEMRNGIVHLTARAFAWVFYRNSGAEWDTIKRAYERFKRDLRDAGFECRDAEDASDDTEVFCIDMDRALIWANGILANDKQPRRLESRADDVQVLDEPAGEALAGEAQEEKRFRKLRSLAKGMQVIRPPAASEPPELYIETEITAPSDDEVDEDASRCIESCRKVSRRRLTKQREADTRRRLKQQAQFKGRLIPVSAEFADVERHRFRSAKIGRPSKNEHCAICGLAWDRHPIHMKPGRGASRRTYFNPQSARSAYVNALRSGLMTPRGLERRLESLRAELDDALYFSYPKREIKIIEEWISDIQAALEIDVWSEAAMERLEFTGKDIRRQEEYARSRAERDSEDLAPEVGFDVRELLGYGPPQEDAPSRLLGDKRETLEKRLKNLRLDLEDAIKFKERDRVASIRAEIDALLLEKTQD